MSTPQTDSHWEFQRQVFQNFEEMIDKWFDGEVSYDEVIQELEHAKDDEDISTTTYMKMEVAWADANEKDEEFKNAELEKWGGLQADSGVY